MNSTLDIAELQLLVFQVGKYLKGTMKFCELTITASLKITAQWFLSAEDDYTALILRDCLDRN